MPRSPLDAPEVEVVVQPMSPEEMTKSWVAQKIINRVLMTVAVVGAIATLVLALRVVRPHQTVVQHPNAVDSLRTEMANLKDQVNAFSAKTESGQIKKVMARLAEVEETATQSGIDARRAEAELTQHRLTNK